MCSICVGVLEEVVIIFCGYLFCNECLYIWFDCFNINFCLFCRLGVLERDVILVLVFRGMIDGLVVYCDNNENGCKMVLKFDKFMIYL